MNLVKRIDENRGKIRAIGLLVAIYSMLTPIENTLLFSGGVTASRYLVYFLMPILSINIIKEGKLYSKKIIITLFILMIIILASILFAPDTMYTIRGVITLVGLMILTILIVEANINMKEYILLKKLNIYVMLFVSVNMVIGTSFISILGDRVTFSDSIDCNVLATSIIIPFLIVLDGIVKKRFKRRYLHYIILFIFLYSILLTGSRARLGPLLLTHIVYLLLEMHFQV